MRINPFDRGYVVIDGTTVSICESVKADGSPVGVYAQHYNITDIDSNEVNNLEARGSRRASKGMLEVHRDEDTGTVRIRPTSQLSNP
jgi:hypothetical protein